MNSFFLILLLSFSALAQQESDFLPDCKKADMLACEKLAALYVSESKWEKAALVGDMLCSKDIVMGCTFAGSSLMALKKIKEGLGYLNKSCDKFEPFACRSLGRFMKNNKEEAMGHLFFKRACHYGLKESCNLKPRKIWSKAAEDFLKKVRSDCVDPALSICQDHLSVLSECKSPLSKEDCLLIPGELSIFFRAKLKQSESKLNLMAILASEKMLKDAPESKGYSYELSKVLKDFKPLNSYHYVFGFMKACRKKYGHKNWKTNSLELYPESYKTLSSRVKANITDYFGKGKQSDCYDPKYGFEAFAVASLDPFNPRRLDVWRTNQDGNWFQVQDGLPIP